MLQSVQQLINMIIDLTNHFRTEFSKYAQQSLAQSTVAMVSPNLKFYATYSQDIHNKLLKIKDILIETRENFFSNASYSYQAFTDRQRSQLIQTIRNNLVEVNVQINELNEGLKKQTIFKKQTEKQHTKAVVLCLFQFYKQIEGIFKQFESFNLKRKKKIEQTIALDKQSEKIKFKSKISVRQGSLFTDEQLEKEAGLLYVQKVSKQKQLEQTKKQAESIHVLMENMSNLVLDQQLKTSAFLEIGETGLFHIDRGNRNLIEANILAKAAGRWWSLLFLSMAISLLVLDFLKS